MNDPRLTESAILLAAVQHQQVQLRSRESGRLFGVLDLATMTILIRKGSHNPVESIDLRSVLVQAGLLASDDDQPPGISLL